MTHTDILKEELADYLLLSGYTFNPVHVITNGEPFFMAYGPQHHISISPSSITFWSLLPEPKHICTYYNVNSLSLTPWALLLHVIGAVDIQDNFRKTKNQSI
jgi:hypothetical protein